MMSKKDALIPQGMRTPRAAAVAGIIFSCLMILSMLLIWISIPANPLGPEQIVIHHLKTISFALNLFPFAGVAFLWFIGVVRDRLGDMEDRFFSTVFLGSGLLFIAMIFTGGAIAAGIIRGLDPGSASPIQTSSYILGRTQVYQLMNIYATKMAAVFMITISTISLPTQIFPRWVSFFGYALAVALLVIVGTVRWITLVFPLWVLLISIHILRGNLRAQSEGQPGE